MLYDTRSGGGQAQLRARAKRQEIRDEICESSDPVARMLCQIADLLELQVSLLDSLIEQQHQRELRQRS